MENTIENKAKFFAQYYGQEIMRWEQWYDTAENSRVGFAPMQSKTGVDKGWYLELTSLSDITDKDAIEVAKIVRSKKEEQIVSEGKAAVQGVIGERIFNSSFFIRPTPENTIGIVDYLRSRGYALPWMGVSVEEQIKRGWIKLKTK